jgi:cytochrome oxidase assembly protein ShyY1
VSPASRDWPRLVTRIDYEALGDVLGTRLVPAVIRLDPSIPWALTARPLRPRFGPMRHVGYAVQWFALAHTVVVIAGVLLHRRRRHHRKQS